MITFKEVQEKDLDVLASLYSVIYLNIETKETWTYETALSYMQYFYHHQPDLFICAYDDNIPIGAIMSTLKPYYDGMHLSGLDIFVSEDYRNQNIGKKLLEMHLELANAKYDVSHIDTIINKNISDYSLNWCKDVCLETNPNFTILNGSLDNCLKKLREEL